MDPVVSSIFGAIVAATGAYLLVLRRLSGKINTSEAQQLWAESTSIRDNLTKRLSDLEHRVSELEKERNQLERDKLKLEREKLDLERQLAIMEERCSSLERENEYFKNLVKKGIIDHGDN